MTRRDTATWTPPIQRPRRNAGRIAFWVLTGLTAALLILAVAIPVVTIQPYTEQSPTMERTVFPGDQMFVAAGPGIRRGDVVVLRVPAKLSGTDDPFVKRVIGLPGDRVSCCDSSRRITVDGKPLDEAYLYPGNQASTTRFSVTLGKGRIWVMGDHRDISIDSRKWGPVPESGVAGRVVFIAHGSSFAALRTPRTFVADGLAPADTRSDLYVRLAVLALAAVTSLLLLSIVGIARFAIRARHSREETAARRLAGQAGGSPAPPDPPGGLSDA